MTEESVRFLADRLAEEYGKELQEKIFDGFSCNRRTSLRVNTLKESTAAVEEELAKNGIERERSTFFADAFLLPTDSEEEVKKLSCYENGGIYLQSLSSMLPPLFLDLCPGSSLLDMAAAPGGKTAQAATMSGSTINITACERHPMRAERLKYNLSKQGAKRVNIMVCDARTLDEFFAFDSVLLDAPCSGSGTVHLPSDSRSEFNDGLLKKITRTQTALLQKGLKLLKKGKTMVYSTCSLFKEENEQVIAAALKSGECELVPLDPTPFTDARFLPGTLAGTLTVLPDERYEGFFVAKLRKK